MQGLTAQLAKFRKTATSANGGMIQTSLFPKETPKKPMILQGIQQMANPSKIAMAILRTFLFLCKRFSSALIDRSPGIVWIFSLKTMTEYRIINTTKGIVLKTTFKGIT